uniref:HTH_Tnp_Tc3_1 domain-containing protein n=1 Tax=Heterorhabditis bacteriophora TaxID=37862 RepID=A0A1I7X4K6_HETBA
MGRASTLSLHERGQTKVLSTTGHTVKRITDVVRCSREAIMNFLRHQEEYGTKKSSGRLSKLNDREKGKFCGLRRITQSALLESRMLDKCPQLTQEHNDERLCWARIFMRYNWEKCYCLGSVQRYRTDQLDVCVNKMNSADFQNVLGHRLVHSRDMNPMESLRTILLCPIYAGNRQLETAKDLQFSISKEWNEVDEGVIRNLVNSMPERIFQVINRNGSCTDY